MCVCVFMCSSVHTLGSRQLGTSIELQADTKKLRMEVSKLLMKHVALTGELQNHMDRKAKNNAELRHLKGALGPFTPFFPPS